MPQVRVMLVEDSPLFMAAMKSAISADVTLTVAGAATNGIEALGKIATVAPDVIVCDVQMPKMDGIEFLKQLLNKYKIPVVVVSSAPGVTLAALASGAVDFIPKPTANEAKELFFNRVRTTIRVAASANVGAKAAFTRPPIKPAIGNIMNKITRPLNDVVVAIGASTGGTDAIADVVRELPPETPGILVTQHMPVGFTAMYASRLDRECRMRVKEAENGDRVQKGLIIIAAGDHHMRLAKDANGYYITSKREEKVNGHMPSVGVLFDSVAQVAKSRSVGIILTGMGADGAEGLVRMRQAGAYTMGQDKQSCVVYGMPMVAYNKGGVVKQLPLGAIPSELIAQLNKM